MQLINLQLFHIFLVKLLYENLNLDINVYFIIFMC